MKGHKIALGGSYTGKTEKLFKSLAKHGVFQFSLVGREVTIQVKSEELEDVIKSLNKLGVDNINILEWRKYGTTVSASGSGSDDNDLISVSLIPSTLGDGLRALSMMSKIDVEDILKDKLSEKVVEELTKAGITDVLYVVQVDGKSSAEGYIEAVKESALNALFNAGGLVGIE